ncbi:MAG: AsmA-like C-terminal region-containing protein, partial [Bacteroidetes bacterium]|nr:AsmA-like C-terminal region-containing protein [Bacteroidota bacterium]
FNPRTVQLEKLDGVVGKSDFRVNGVLDNLFGYYFNKELLKGSFTFNSYIMDLNQFMSDNTTTATADTAPASVIEIPENVDFMLTAAIGKLFYENKVLESVKGNVAMRDRTLGLNDISFNIAGGAVVMDGVYQTKDVRSPYFNFDLALQNFDIQTTVKTFSTVKKVAAIAERCNGKFSSGFSVNGRMDDKMDPVMQSLNGGGKLTTQSVMLSNFEPVNKLADALKMDQYKQMSLSNVNLSFKFKDGSVFVEPFETSLAGTKATISGSTGFDQKLNYDINLAIPKAMMGAAATGVVNNMFAGINKAAGTSFAMPDPVNIKVNMLGTVQKPEIKTSLKDAAGSVAAGIKQELQNQLDSKRQDLEDKAKAEADRLKSEAEAKAKAEADRIKKEAEAKAKAEADRLKKEAEDKAKKAAEDQLKNLFNKKK